MKFYRFVVLLQILSEVLPQVQSKLSEKRRKSEGHEEVSSKLQELSSKQLGRSI